MKPYLLYLIIATLLLFTLSGTSLAILFNGDFETGDLSGWLQKEVIYDDYGLIVESDGSNHYAKMWARDTVLGLIHKDRFLPSVINFKLSYDFEADLPPTAWFESESDGAGTLLQYRNGAFKFYGWILDPLYVRPSKVFSDGYHISMIVNYSSYPSSNMDNWALVLYNWYDTENIATVKIDNVNMHPVPEPSTIFILGNGLLGLSVLRKKLKNK
jgi:hypothetical protein